MRLSLSITPDVALSHYLYLWPCAYEDLVKLGISRDPLARVRAFSPRWFEFFDLDHAQLLEADLRSDVQAAETRLKRELKLLNAPPPLLVPPRAAGHTEWFRGGTAEIAMAMQLLRGQGYRLHAPARAWLRAALDAESDRLYGWAEAMLQSLHDLGDDPSAAPLRQALRDACDAQCAMDLPLAERVSPAVLAWYETPSR